MRDTGRGSGRLTGGAPSVEDQVVRGRLGPVPKKEREVAGHRGDDEDLAVRGAPTTFAQSCLASPAQVEGAAVDPRLVGIERPQAACGDAAARHLGVRVDGGALVRRPGEQRRCEEDELGHLPFLPGEGEAPSPPFFYGDILTWWIGWVYG